MAECPATIAHPLHILCPILENKEVAEFAPHALQARSDETRYTSDDLLQLIDVNQGDATELDGQSQLVVVTPLLLVQMTAKKGPIKPPTVCGPVL